MRVSACRSCEAAILWAVTPKGKRIPVDELPSKGGTLALLPTDDTPLAIALTGRTLAAARRADARLYISHFATCPDARRWRRSPDEAQQQ